MHKLKTTVARMSIDVDFSARNLSAATWVSDEEIPHDAPELIQQLAEGAVAILKNHGFVRSVLSDPTVSELHGGYSLYLVYLLETEDRLIKLILDLRTSNHKAKPDFVSSFNHRDDANSSALAKEYKSRKQKDAVRTEHFDLAYQERNWGAQFFVGSGTSYSAPVATAVQALDIFDKKIAKLVDRYSEGD